MLAEKLYHTYHNLPAPTILVIGDLMLDHYIFGSSSRLSPEAPVPIVNAQKEKKIIGGAANVASNLVELGAKVCLCGILGDDLFAIDIEEILKEKGIESQLIIKDKSRKTTVKTRVIVGNHQIVRIDNEDLHPISVDIEDFFFNNLLSQLDKASIVILSDYNKGLLTPTLCAKIINYCKPLNKKVLVDPKGLDYGKYEGAYLIKPNRKELSEVTKASIINSNDDELIKAGRTVLLNTKTSYLIVTLSEAGIAIITAQDFKVIPVIANEVYDVTGAGDTVIATLAYCIASGFTMEEAASIANHAASIVIKHIGSACTNINEIISSLEIK